MPVAVVDYDPDWPAQFARLRDRIWPVVHDVALGLEHVGSTAVPGLAAKAVIDLDIIIESRDHLTIIVKRLAGIGYQHRGDLGIQDREAFSIPRTQTPHHLYVCPRDSVALRNHLTLRDHLRAHPQDRLAYSALKRDLAMQYPDDIDSYVKGKSEFILAILAAHDFASEGLDAIRVMNRR